MKEGDKAGGLNSTAYIGESRVTTGILTMYLYAKYHSDQECVGLG